MQYDAANDDFFFNWPLGSRTGNVTITVQVTYPGSSTKTGVSELIHVTT